MALLPYMAVVLEAYFTIYTDDPVFEQLSLSYYYYLYCLDCN